MERRQVRLAGWVGLVSNLGLVAIKLGVGLVGHSQALVADAAHSLSDLVSDAALIIGVRYWTAPADSCHPHGHRRIETAVTVLIGALLVFVALGIVEHAVEGLRGPERPPPGGVALAGALLSIAVKEVLYWWTLVLGRRIGSSAVEANAWHHRTDALSSIPAALAVGVAMLVPGWSFIDPIGAMVICLFILWAAWKVMSPALKQLVDAAAPEEVRSNLEAVARSVRGVENAHALRTRYIGSQLAVDLHIEVSGDLSVREGHAIGEEVRRRLMAGPQVADALVKVEPVQQHAGNDDDASTTAGGENGAG